MDAEHHARAGGGRLRVALVGAGLVGQAAHAITLAEDRARFEFVAVVDPSATVRNGELVSRLSAVFVVPHLAVGASVHIPDDETRAAPERLRDWLVEQAITISFLLRPNQRRGSGA